MQGDSIVTSFFTDLQASWDQLLNLRPLPSCSCGKCTCGVNEKILHLHHQDSIMQFLNGLNDCYSQVKNQVFNQGSFPSGNNSKNFKGNVGKGRPVCSYYEDKCYKLVGFPPGYKQKGKVPMANQVMVDCD